MRRRNLLKGLTGMVVASAMELSMGPSKAAVSVPEAKKEMVGVTCFVKMEIDRDEQGRFLRSRLVECPIEDHPAYVGKDSNGDPILDLRRESVNRFFTVEGLDEGD